MYRKDVLGEGRRDDARSIRRGSRSRRSHGRSTRPSMAGICLRGKPGWGDLGASFTTVLNTFGGTWWSSTSDGKPAAAQVDQPAFKTALDFYAKLVQDAGEKDAANSSFNECLAQYQAGKVAMWYDATVAAGLLEAKDSPVKGKNGYALAPVDKTKASGLAVELGARDPEELARSRGRLEVHLLGDRPAVHQGRRHEDEGRLGRRSRRERALSTYEIPQYKQAATAFASKTLAAMKAAPINNPGTTKRPGSTGCAVRRHPAVPGCRQPLHAALLERDRGLDEGHRRAQPVPADRLAGDQVAPPLTADCRRRHAEGKGRRSVLLRVASAAARCCRRCSSRSPSRSCRSSSASTTASPT